jgi:hypothetical protein
VSIRVRSRLLVLDVVVVYRNSLSTTLGSLRSVKIFGSQHHSAMNYREILSRLDSERQTIPDPDTTLERTQGVIRGIAKLGNRNAIVYSSFSAEESERIIESEIDYFNRLARGFEWKVYRHDEPADLLERLRQRGFTIGTEEALMILDLEALPPILMAPFPGGITVRPVNDERAIEYFLQLETQIWGASFTTGGSFGSIKRIRSGEILPSSPM